MHENVASRILQTWQPYRVSDVGHPFRRSLICVKSLKKALFIGAAAVIQQGW